MTRIALTGGAYTALSVVASAQRQVNLYSEPMPAGQGEPAKAALYPTPGTRLLVTMPKAPIRGGRRATNGVLYVAAGDTVYAVNSSWSYSSLGTITPGLRTPVAFADNGLDLVVVDGTANGWAITLADSSFAPIVDPTGSFRGGTRVDYLDTFFLFAVPNTPQLQSSNSLATTFNPLYFANKSAHSDLLVSVVVAKREIWLLGTETTEIWINSGKADFPFESMPGVFIDRGCVAKYSPAETDNGVYWLSADRQGQGIVMKGSGYQATRISTFAIEQELATYARIDDAIGMTYQLGGHLFYVLAFPHADKCWAYDIAASQAAQEPRWHEWVWLDANGTEHRHRANCIFPAYGEVMVGDWQNGNLYALDQSVGTDNAAPIMRRRDWPHILADGKRVRYENFIADLETGTGGNQLPIPPRVSLAWSDDRGHSFGSPISQSMGASGQYLRSLNYRRLGMGRDRVFSLSWSAPQATVLQGAWIDAEPASS